MANFVYTADDLYTGSPSAPNANLVRRSFVCTLATMLGQTGATGVGLGDIILLAPIPGNVMLTDFVIRIPELDTGSSIAYDVGDNVILSGATNINVSTTAQTTQATAGGTFTLTASASTASFTSTNAFLSINGCIIAYAALSGSTFTTCNAQFPNFSLPAGALIQQMGNQNVYGAVVLPNGSANAVSIHPDFAVSGTAVTTSTSKPGALPVRYAAPFITQPSGTNPAVPAQIGQRYFSLVIHTAPGTYNAPAVPITGHIDYFLTGYPV